MSSIGPGEMVPEEHCEQAENIYRRIRWLLANNRSFDEDSEVSAFQPMTVEVDPELRGEFPGASSEPIYATIHDAFIARRSLASNTDYVFRGHSDARWALQPSRDRLRALEVQNFHDSIRQRFIGEVRACHPDFSEDQLDALSQHYGFPTYLLDVSESFDIAGFFASEPRWSFERSRNWLDNIGCIWVFPRHALVSQRLYIPRDAVGHHQNQRLMRQRGAFVAVRTADKVAWLKECGTAVVFNRVTQSTGKPTGAGGIKQMLSPLGP